jgi:hypothetical protein
LEYTAKLKAWTSRRHKYKKNINEVTGGPQVYSKIVRGAAKDKEERVTLSPRNKREEETAKTKKAQKKEEANEARNATFLEYAFNMASISMVRACALQPSPT